MNANLIDLIALFGKLGILSFGGGQIALGEISQRVIERGWLTDTQFAEAYAFGQLSPGPGSLWIIPIGYAAGGLPGAIAAFVAFFGPPMVLAIFGTNLWYRVRESEWPTAVRTAVLPITVGLGASAAYSMLPLTVRDGPGFAVFLVSALLLWRTAAPMLAVLAGAATVGVLFLAY